MGEWGWVRVREGLLWVAGGGWLFLMGGWG